MEDRRPLTIDDFKPYVFEPGIVSTQGFINGNSGGSTGLAWCLIALSGGRLPRADIFAVFRQICDGDGILRRGPGSTVFCPAEDHYAFWAGLFLNGDEGASELISYGWKHLWFIGPKTWKDIPRSWFGRFPGLIAHLYYCAGKRPNFILRFFWRLAVTHGDSQDSFMQRWAMIQAISKSQLFGLTKIYSHEAAAPELNAIAKFWDQLRASAYKDMRGVMRAYIGDENHPLVRLMQDYA